VLSIKETVYCSAPVGLFPVDTVFWIIQCRIPQISLLLVLKETAEYYIWVRYCTRFMFVGEILVYLKVQIIHLLNKSDA